MKVWTSCRGSSWRVPAYPWMVVELLDGWPFHVSHPRYRAIVKEPLLYYPYFTQRDLVETVLYLWILPTVIVTIFPLINPTEIAYNNQTFICEQAWTSQGTTADAKKVFYGFTLFILPLLVIMILNYSVFKTAREKCVEPAGATSQAQITRREKFHQEHRAAIDVFIVVGAFLLLFLPLWVSGIARRFLSKDGLDASLYLIPNDFTLASAVCNPFIYATRKRQFRRAMLSVLRCRGSAAGPVIPQSPAPERWTVPPGPGIRETAAGNVAGCSGVHPLGVDRGEVGELANRSNRPLP